MESHPRFPTDLRPTFLAHVLAFGRALRAEGLPASPAKLIDLCRAMEHIDVGVRADVRVAAGTTLVSRKEDFELFDHIFEAYWTPCTPLAMQELQTDMHEMPGSGRDADDDPSMAEVLHLLSDEQGPTEDTSAASARLTSFSDRDVLMLKDLAKLDDSELDEARRMIGELARALRNRPGLRFRPARRGTIVDFRRSFRNDATSGFAGLGLRYRKPRNRKLNLMLLCDVSGSMQHYSTFLLEFMYALRGELPRMEAAVFTTHMTPVSRQLESRDASGFTARLAESVGGWGGGTNIGQSLAEFTDHHSGRMARSRTVMIILSDGWDRGEPRAMTQAIATLRQQVSRLIWLNPLLGRSDYRPLCRGIRSALPYLDLFMPAHNLASLAKVVEMLRNPSSNLAAKSRGIVPYD